MCLISSGDDSAYGDMGIVGYLPKATSFMPDADELSGTEDMHDMDLDARAMDQDGERPGEGSLCDSGKNKRQQFQKAFTTSSSTQRSQENKSALCMGNLRNRDGGFTFLQRAAHSSLRMLITFSMMHAFKDGSENTALAIEGG